MKATGSGLVFVGHPTGRVMDHSIWTRCAEEVWLPHTAACVDLDCGWAELTSTCQRATSWWKLSKQLTATCRMQACTAALSLQVLVERRTV